MKRILILILVVLPFSVSGQSMTGPGIKDEPPTVGPTTKKGVKISDPSYIEAEEGKPGSIRQEQQLEEGNPDTTNEVGPKGKKAQEAAKKGKFEISEEEQLKKQKHE